MTQEQIDSRSERAQRDLFVIPTLKATLRKTPVGGYDLTNVSTVRRSVSHCRIK
jgi:hypothetical protein